MNDAWTLHKVEAGDVLDSKTTSGLTCHIKEVQSSNFVQAVWYTGKSGKPLTASHITLKNEFLSEQWRKLTRDEALVFLTMMS